MSRSTRKPGSRILLIATTFAYAALVAEPVLACRATVEFERYANAVSQLDPNAEGVQELLAKFQHALAMHKEGHNEGNMRKMLQAYKLLKEIKAQIQA